MLFNSFEFIFAFFPICVFGYFLLARYFSLESALGFLVLASLFFYAYWKPIYLLLILFSIGFNYLVGRSLAASGQGSGKKLLVFGVATNLSLLAYFKYANFFVENVRVLVGADWNMETIFLPLAISFFTFQQISYLVDAYRGETSEYNFLHYCLFVCFFPQLIAGPIVHHKDMLPQFLRPENLSPQWSNFAVGMSIFAIGLFKKTVLADSLSDYVSPVYDNTTAGDLDFFRAWGSTLAYTFQLYFDFSGYSDMAVGAARVFGIRLPINFFSPLKATSIVEFWRRWHMTLSRFLRDYLYIALGGNRRGPRMRYVNLFLTMLLGGLWHGAGWTFVIWGALHGSYLMVNHGWRNVMARMQWDLSASRSYALFGWFLTFMAWVVSMVYFRAPDVTKANEVLVAMMGFSGFAIPAGILVRLGELGHWLTQMGIGATHGGGAQFVANYIWVAFTALFAFALPNVAQIFHRYEPVLYENEKVFGALRTRSFLVWDYNYRWVVAVAIAGVAGLLTLQQVSEFLYFQF